MKIIKTWQHRLARHNGKHDNLHYGLKAVSRGGWIATNGSIKKARRPWILRYWKPGCASLGKSRQVVGYKQLWILGKASAGK